MSMRRWLTFAAFLLSISLVPVCAQRSGRGGGGGGHGGFGWAYGGFGGHGGGGFSSHGFTGPGLGGGSHIASSHFAPSHLGSRVGGGFGSRGEHFRGRDRGFTRFNSRLGYGYPYRYGYGYPYWGYYDPYWDWWWDSGSSYDQDAEREREIANEMNAQNIEEQERLREQDQDVYAARRPQTAAVQPTEEAEKEAPTVLVFRDQHQREIQNYAIADGLLWNFTGSRTEKIPLAILDIPATVKANDDRGVEFHLPRPSEGQ